MSAPASSEKSVTVDRDHGVGRAFALITLLGSALLVIGTFMPWGASYDTYFYPLVGSNGMPGDGIFTLGAGIGAACVGVARLVTATGPGVRIAQAVAGAVAVIVAIYDWSDLYQAGRMPMAGLFVAVFAGIIIVIGAGPTGGPDRT